MDLIQRVKDLTGWGFEDLEMAERDTIMSWQKSLEGKEITVDSVRVFIKRWHEAIDDGLANHKLGKNQDLFLKARLKNIILLEAFLAGPEKAKAAVEMYLDNLKDRLDKRKKE